MYFSVMKGHMSITSVLSFGVKSGTYTYELGSERWTGLSPWNIPAKPLMPADQRIRCPTTMRPPNCRDILHGSMRNLNMFRGHPLLTVWVSPALPFLALLLSVILLIKRKGNKVLLIAWAFPLLYWATLALGASDVRALCSAAFLHATADCHHSLYLRLRNCD